MSFEIKQASRTSVKPLICFYSESGCGKTYSALLLARGFVGPSGKITMADTESGRGSLYADVIPGGYRTFQIAAPFSPMVAIDAIRAVEQDGAQIGILDSGSHFWEGIGGVLDMAGEAEAKSGKAGLHNWRIPKMEHAKFMLALLQSSIPWIICLRAKHKTKQGKNQQGRTEIVKDDFTTPIQADDFIFETTCHGEIMQDHTFRLTKCSHPDLRRCLPNNEMVTIKHGELLAGWCSAPGGPGTNKPETVDPEVKKLKSELWKLTAEKHGGKAANLEMWLIGENLISDTEDLSTLSAKRLSEVIAALPKQ